MSVDKTIHVKQSLLSEPRRLCIFMSYLLVLIDHDARNRGNVDSNLAVINQTT